MAKTLRVFQYTIILQPSDKEKGQVLVPISEITAASEREARIVAERAIPDKWMTELDRVEVQIRPFV